MRSLAETENVRRPPKREVDTAKQFAMQGFCKDLLEIADTLGIVTANAEPKDAKAKPAEEAAAKRTPEEVAKAYEDLLEAPARNQLDPAARVREARPPEHRARRGHALRPGAPPRRVSRAARRRQRCAPLPSPPTCNIEFYKYYKYKFASSANLLDLLYHMYVYSTSTCLRIR